MWDVLTNITARLSNLIISGTVGQMTDKQFLEKEIARWKRSPERMMQIKSFLYYNDDHDILHRKRQMIGEDGKLEDVENLPNNHIIDNQYGKLVNQKANYLLGQPFTVDSENDQYAELLKDLFNKRFMKLLKNAGKAMLNGGIAWLHPYYRDDGQLAFHLFPAYEILPFWSDSEHTELEFAIRLYTVQGYNGTEPVLIEKVEVYDLEGLHRYTLDGGTLTPDVDENGQNTESYITYTDSDGHAEGLNWTKVPLIPLKYNEQETPLLKKVKSLQDGINVMLSDFENGMQEDNRNTILILKNYDGENLGEFRKNLSTFGVVKVRSDDGADGGVETLEITVNSENYKAILDLFKKALIENGMGYDAKDDRLGGNPNQMNIQSMYSDIDLDANDMETELQAAFEDILWFVDAHLYNTGKGDFSQETVNITFNRDILINESEAIQNCKDSVGILSDETIVTQHPWVDDPAAELERLKKQKEERQQEFEAQNYNPFKENNPPGADDGGEDDG